MAFINFPTPMYNTHLPTYATLGSVLDDPREQGSALNKDGQAFTFFKVTDTDEKNPDAPYFHDWHDFIVDVRHPCTAAFYRCHWTGFRLPRSAENDGRKWVVLAYPAALFAFFAPEGSLQKLMTLVYGQGSPSSPVPLPKVPRLYQILPGQKHG